MSLESIGLDWVSFQWPVFLWGLLLIPLLVVGYVLVQRRRMRYAMRFTNVDLLENVVHRSPGWRRGVPPILFLAALTALIVGLARPHATLLIPKEEATVILAMDTSRSMLADDVDPTRLAAAQDAAEAFLDEVPGNFRVGVVGFSSEAYVLATPTDDREIARDAIDSLEADGGTAIGDAIVRAVDISGAGDVQLASDTEPVEENGDSPPLVVLLLSDGEPSPETLDPSEAARIAESAGVPVYTVALGTDEGTVEIENLFGFSETVPVPPDHDTLSEIAQTTGGQFFDAPSDEALTTVYESLGSSLGFDEDELEITFAFAGAGLLLFLIGGVFSALWFNRIP